MFQPVRTDPPADLVWRITFVPFLTDGRCVLIDEPDGPALPSGAVLDGEDYRLDTVLRVPLQTAGFRYQRFHPFGVDRHHLYAPQWASHIWTGNAADWRPPTCPHRLDYRRLVPPLSRVRTSPLARRPYLSGQRA